MRTSPILETAIAVQESVVDFRSGISVACDLLVENRFVKAGYVKAVIENLEKLGPYFMVAPQVAIAHAKPSDLVLSPGISLLKLNQPVDSGNELHPEATMIFALATPNPTAHIELMGSLAELLSDSAVMNSLLNASAKSVIWEIFNS